MATIISCSALSSIRASSEPGSTKSDPSRKKPVSSVSWWAPLFGMSSEPDYVNKNISSSVNLESDLDKTDKRSLRCCLTEEKAKQLRRKTAEASTFHDVMYHSAIASRLASDVRVKE
ncbi:unnamed protein product [Arabidopsis lyrata]|uniref:uncharacterized protein LOC9321166 n=1 Tax=Arabidopsis lyrata subsp. lyrata TaxID=81972 RepID=UPI000A29D1BA|nr:uncharacterized protein LOC9321166 [Arabidopsis lyrata subsp. lyrata]CAH8260617.1 unnamed protein product [Arabidopsis lyrata]|eukprot:XP_020889493.1 uncharacterized protein LOC9321166 [Arabidopsis lyrata subsp. lyrata]